MSKYYNPYAFERMSNRPKRNGRRRKKKRLKPKGPDGLRSRRSFGRCPPGFLKTYPRKKSSQPSEQEAPKHEV